MKKVTLTRSDDQTFGVLRYKSLKWFSVERPWEENANDISCIPKGKYVCKWTLSPRLKKYTYEITKVPKRAGIRIHSANFPSQLKGCIAPGKTTGVMDGKRGVFLSVVAVRELETAMNKQDFELEIN